MLYSLLMLVAILAVAGVLLWAITQIPMDATIARMIRVVIIVVVAIYLIFWVVGLAQGIGPMGPSLRLH